MNKSVQGFAWKYKLCAHPLISQCILPCMLSSWPSPCWAVKVSRELLLALAWMWAELTSMTDDPDKTKPPVVWGVQLVFRWMQVEAHCRSSSPTTGMVWDWRWHDTYRDTEARVYVPLPLLTVGASLCSDELLNMPKNMGSIEQKERKGMAVP